MSAGFYAASVPMFQHYLGRLHTLLAAAEAHAQRHGIAASDLLQARLAQDMLPLAMQVQIAANFTLRTCFPLAGLAIPSYDEFPDTFDGLHGRLDHVAGLLGTLAPAAFQVAESRTIESRAGEALVLLPARDFLFLYAIPNFFFHVTAAYSILRHQGVPIGKAQFDGFHIYPPTA